MRTIRYLAILFILVISITLAGLSFPVFARPLAATAPGLGTAGSFAVLGASAVTNTGPSVLNGNLGVSPGTAISGFPPGSFTGTLHSADAAALQAQNDATAAYNVLASQSCTRDLTGQDLGGMTLTPGVYCYNSSAQLTGALTLNAVGDPNAVWIFKIGSTLTTASNSSVGFINSGSGPGCNLFWKVGSSATLGTTTAFKGNILASVSITLNTNANLIGRALALTGAVTLDSNNITTTGCAAPVNATATRQNTSTPTVQGTQANSTLAPTVQGTQANSTLGPTEQSTQANSTLAAAGTLLPAVTGMPGAGGAPIRNQGSPWSVLFVIGLGLLAVFLLARAYYIYRWKQ